MAPRDEREGRKPSGSRPNVRRLFAGRHDSTASSDTDGQSQREQDSLYPLRQSRAGLSEAPSSDARIAKWSDKDVISTSPAPGADFDFLPKTAVRTLTAESEVKSHSSKFRLNKPNSLQLAHSKSAGDLTSPSPPASSKWDYLRQHVLPPEAHSTIDSPLLPPSLPFASSSSRPSTPKSTRFAVLDGFRQVVDHARSATNASNASAIAAMDEARRFAEDLRKACWISRYGEAPHAAMPASTTVSSTGRRPKMERGATQTSMSSTVYPMTTTTSLPLNPSLNSSSVALPPSMHSKASSARGLTDLPSGPALLPTSIAPLCRTLKEHAMLAEERYIASSLPIESEVLATLLLPFFSSRNPLGAKSTDSEQMAAVEAFEIVVNTWPSPSNVTALERVLWACKCAMLTTASRVRNHLLGAISLALFSRGRSLRADRPFLLQALLMALYDVLATLACSESHQELQPSIEVIKDLITRVEDGVLGMLDPKAVQDEYRAMFASDEDGDIIREGVARGGLIRCLEWTHRAKRTWLLANLVEIRWPTPSSSPASRGTRLSRRISIRNMSIFLGSSVIILRSPSSDPSNAPLAAKCILRFLHTRVLPEIDGLPQDEEGIADMKASVISLLFGLVAVAWTIGEEEGRDDAQKTLEILIALHGRSATEKAWKEAFDQAARDMMPNSEDQWPQTLLLLESLFKGLPDVVKKTLMATIMSLLNDRLTTIPPVECEQVASLMTTLSYSYPQMFFRPLFSLANAAKKETTIQHMTALTALSELVPDLWIRDAMMMGVAIGSDVGGAAAIASDTRQSVASTSLPRAKARLGQTTLLVEMIVRLRALRLGKAKDSGTEVSFRTAASFASNLEARLAVYIDAKEKTIMLPMSHRTLYCVLFLDIRLLTRSLRPAAWLSNVVTWTLRALDQSEDDDFRYYGGLRFTRDEEMEETFDLVKKVYAEAQQGLRDRSAQRRSALALTPSPESLISGKVLASAELATTLANGLNGRLELIDRLLSGFVQSALQLLVAVSGLLSVDDHRRLGKALWDRCLDGEDHEVVQPACFLIMQAAEKAPDAFNVVLQEDMQSLDAGVRRQAVRKLSTLFGWRFQILSQNFVVDRTHPRPFKLTRPQPAFLPTDIGTSRYVREENPDDYKDSDGTTLPPELRKRLADMGWDHGIAPEVDRKLEWARTPMSLLPIRQLNRLDDSGTSFEALSPVPSPTSSPSVTPSKSPPTSGGHTELLRRKSSGSSSGGKRRAVFVPTLANVFPRLASLLFDPDYTVHSEARNLIIMLMKEDPSLIGRPVYDLLTCSEEDVTRSFSALRAYLHIGRVLPPAMAHDAFNHLAGFLKFLRQSKHPGSHRMYAQATPIMSKLVMQVSGMSMRELRRAKTDVYLIPTGVFWAPLAAPESDMFPKYLARGQNIFDELPLQVISQVMIRTSQNMLFLEMLKRNSQDVQVVRKQLDRLVLPTRDGSGHSPPLKLQDFVPRRRTAASPVSPQDALLKQLSTTLSYSHILLIAQVFRSVTRHLNDRTELSSYVDGLNQILLAHGEDGGIVTQVLVALMVAATRFERLFMTGNAYALFMPAVIKVYVECLRRSDLSNLAEDDTEPAAGNPVRDAIEHAVIRFYTLHTEAFVFQTLEIVARMIKVCSIQDPWISQRLCRFFCVLENGPAVFDSSGIRGANRDQEREAELMRAAEEKPQAFLASFRRTGSNASGAPAAARYPVDAALEFDEDEGKRLGMDNLVRLFLTVIAHDPTVLRAELFLRLLSRIATYLCNTSAALILREGIDALGIIMLTRAAGRSKVPEVSQLRTAIGLSAEVFSSDKQLDPDGSGLGKASSPSDLQAMRQDYLALVIAFVTGGGQVSIPTLSRVVDLITALSNPTSESGDFVCDFLCSFLKSSLDRDPAPDVKDVSIILSRMAPLVKSRALDGRLSGIYETLEKITAQGMYASDVAFTRIVLEHYCAAGLDTCVTTGLAYQLQLHSSPVLLICHAITFPHGDVLAQIENTQPTYAFLLGVVLPVTLTMKTSREALMESRGSGGTPYGRAWVRLLAYAMDACESTTRHSELTRAQSLTGARRSVDRRSADSAPWDAAALTLAMAVQIIKVVIARATDEVTEVLAVVWLRVAALMKTVLAEGDGTFTSTVTGKPSPSPATSPAATPSSPVSFNTEFSFMSAYQTPSAGRAGFTATAVPRLLDYLLWSTLEFVCLHRSPLTLHMRGFMQEKAVVLHQDLINQPHFTNSFGSSGSGGGPGTPRTSMTPSLFSKVRRRSAYNSGVPAQNSSMFLQPTSQAYGGDMSSANLSVTEDGVVRRAGYSRMSIAPLKDTEKGKAPKEKRPRIVHLGPAEQQRTASVSRSPSPGTVGHGTRAEQKDQRPADAAKLVPLKSPSMVARTYRAVRTVQASLGYPLVSVPPACDRDEAGESEATLGAMGMTMADILDRVIYDTKAVLEEINDAEESRPNQSLESH